MRDRENRRRYLTTTQAARLAHISPSTLLRSIQNKKLKAFSTPGGHFRIDPASLNTFLKASGLESAPEKRVLVLSLPGGEISRLVGELKKDPVFSVSEASTLAEAEKLPLPSTVLVVPGAKRSAKVSPASFRKLFR